VPCRIDRGQDDVDQSQKLISLSVCQTYATSGGEEPFTARDVLFDQGERGFRARRDLDTVQCLIIHTCLW
jgi:hypothetical protein